MAGASCVADWGARAALKAYVSGAKQRPSSQAWAKTVPRTTMSASEGDRNSTGAVHITWPSYSCNSTLMVGCLTIFGGRDGVNAPATRTAGDSAAEILVARKGRGCDC